MKVSMGILVPIVLGAAAIGGAIAYLFVKERKGVDSLSLQDQVIGSIALVTIAEESGMRGTARANGELWSFDSTEPLRPGDEADVVSMHGLRIQLKRRTR